ncbi:protein phosphatase PTC7 homolog [Anopheles bellator]|uniref:protein phosphatase PTC7 homolog n=1 Tax=Anopheles bellator TaxID=139047 RepID=UPI002647E5ED|nr:protein phosphatase PTC7 homolog [Anopheles bellator]
MRSWMSRWLTRALHQSIQNAGTSVESRPRTYSRFISVVSGFPKNLAQAKYKQTKGKIGDDAWFIAKTQSADVLGVADGVGGWRSYGIDPGEFAEVLMKNCERLVNFARFDPVKPVNLIASGYRELRAHRESILGSSTACIVVFNREDSSIYTANIGDSGFIIVRKGEIVHRSEEQQHYFNTPFQLSLPPAGHTDVLSDSPESANTTTFPVCNGDVILVATDGVFDNVPIKLLVETLHGMEGVYDQVKLQMCANSIALMARSLSFDSKFLSPFSLNARRNNISAMGGKPDDITVVLATVAL